MIFRRYHPLLVLISIFSLSVASAAERAGVFNLIRLRVEYASNPLGIDAHKPRLSWQIEADDRGVKQSAYQVRVALSERDLQRESALLWDSGKVVSEDSTHCPYEGPALQSGNRYHWQVRIWDGQDRVSNWSTPAYWEMGLLAPSDWQANWIEPDLQEDVSKPGPSPMLRTTFKLKNNVERARAYVTSHGLYEMHLNGQRVGDQLFTPGWTSYSKRLQYQTYDVTALLQRGENAVGVLLGNGWYRGEIGFTQQRNQYGDRLALLMQIKVTYRGGGGETIITDGSWKATTGPILMSEIYHGETYDARLEKIGWTTSGYDDGQWSGVRLAVHRKDHLVAPAGPPVRRIEEVRPIEILQTPAGETVVDMGQNLVGWVKLRVRGPSGTTVALKHAEVLDREGNFYTENLRTAKQTVQYTLKGDGIEIFEPHFTFQGFRYVAVEGYPGTLTLDSLTGVVIYSDMTLAGEFETSNPLINQLQRNIIWGQKGNFLDVPTDCPQRDERLGWTGDAQVFARTAAFNMDVSGFFTKWMRDVAADQLEDGSVPHVVPDILSQPGKPATGSAAWADAAVIIPWTIYLSYGDKRILEEQYDSMVRWVEYAARRAGDDYVWHGDFHFGDWLAYATTRSDYPGATTGKDLIATAFFAHSTDLLRGIAQVLDKQEDAARYSELSSKIRSAFCREFVTATGRVGENTQTAYALALQFDLLPEDLRPVAAARLAREVRERKHLTTGFVGTPYLCHVLSRHGYLDEAYLLLNREDYPSWLYPVKQGATTIWERWDGQKPDGSFQDKGMNSFNHYAYGAIGEWMYRVMAGIEIDESAPAYKHVLIQPQPGGGFTWVKASHDTLYGKVSSAWKLEKGGFELVVEIPANTRATVRLPGADLGTVLESGKALPQADGIGSSRQDGDSVVLEIGSGRYRFDYPANKLLKRSLETAAAGVAGSWQFLIYTPVGDREVTADFQQQGNKVTGTFGSADVEGSFADGQWDLSFPFTYAEAGMTGTLAFRGRLEDGILKGTWDFQGFGGTFEARRIE
jgi:alpha-L-rhamnosidase